jgi:chromosome segregation ATPase
MLSRLLIMLAALIASAAFAQPPGENRSEALQQAQIRASASYRELTEAEFQMKLAEQDYLNTQEAYRAALQRAEDIKRELDKTKKALDAARARQARARKDYDAALDAVEKAWGRPPAGK